MGLSASSETVIIVQMKTANTVWAMDLWSTDGPNVSVSFKTCLGIKKHKGKVKIRWILGYLPYGVQYMIMKKIC